MTRPPLSAAALYAVMDHYRDALLRIRAEVRRDDPGDSPDDVLGRVEEIVECTDMDFEETAGEDETAPSTPTPPGIQPPAKDSP